MIKNVTIITKREIIYFLMYFVFLLPLSLLEFNSVKILYYILLATIDSILFIKWLAFNKKSFVTLIVIIYHVYLLFLTVINKGAIMTAIRETLLYVGICLLTELIIAWNPGFLIDRFLKLLRILVILNLVSILLFPKGLYKTDLFGSNYYLLGYDNQNINIILPMVILSCLRYKYYGIVEKKQYMISSIIALSTVFIIKSIASIEVLLFFYLLTTPRILNNNKIVDFKKLFFVNIFISVILIIFQGQKYFEYFFVNVLNRSLTISGRTYIWAETFNLIKRKPFFGYGVISPDNRAAMLSTFSVVAGLHAHNRFMETLFRGGIVGLFLLLISLFYSFSINKYNRKTVVYKLMVASVFAYLMGMITEYYRYAYFFFPMLIMAEKSEIIDKKFKIR